MELRKVTAIFDETRLKTVEAKLIDHGVSGFTLHPVRGRGRYFDSFDDDHLINHIQLEVYARSIDAKAIAELIVDTAYTGADSEGLVAIVPVCELYWVHDKRPVDVGDFHYHEVKHG